MEKSQVKPTNQLLGTWDQGLGQDLESGCPKLANGKFWGVLFFQERPEYTQTTTSNMYLLIEIQHDALIQCHLNYVQVGKLQLYAQN